MHAVATVMTWQPWVIELKDVCIFCNMFSNVPQYTRMHSKTHTTASDCKLKLYTAVCMDPPSLPFGLYLSSRPKSFPYLSQISSPHGPPIAVCLLVSVYVVIMSPSETIPPLTSVTAWVSYRPSSRTFPFGWHRGFLLRGSICPRRWCLHLSCLCRPCACRVPHQKIGVRNLKYRYRDSSMKGSSLRLCKSKHSVCIKPCFLEPPCLPPPPPPPPVPPPIPISFESPEYCPEPQLKFTSRMTTVTAQKEEKLLNIIINLVCVYRQYWCTSWNVQFIRSEMHTMMMMMMQQSDTLHYPD